MISQIQTFSPHKNIQKNPSSRICQPHSIQHDSISLRLRALQINEELIKLSPENLYPSYLLQQILYSYQLIMKTDNIKFKILLIGPSGVGKTSLLLKYVHNKFSYDYQVTTGIQYFSKQVQINQKTNINLQIWDTMGQEAFKSVVKTHYRGVAAVIFFYSIQNKQSFNKLGSWIKQVKDNVHQETVFFLVGTKLDLEDVRKISKEEGESYGKEIKSIFFQEISSKTGQNVKQLFDKLSKAIYKKYQASRAFKQLVKPLINNIEKSESFRLRKDDVKKKEKEEGCC